MQEKAEVKARKKHRNSQHRRRGKKALAICENKDTYLPMGRRGSEAQQQTEAGHDAR